MLTNIKLSKARISETTQSSRFFGELASGFAHLGKKFC